MCMCGIPRGSPTDGLGPVVAIAIGRSVALDVPGRAACDVAPSAIAAAIAITAVIAVAIAVATAVAAIIAAT